MKELNEVAEKAETLFGTNDSMSIDGNWAKWYHAGIPDGPEDERNRVRKEYANKLHCLDCTAMSGCFFIDGVKTFTPHPHHPNCHCKKLKESPTDVMVLCPIEKIKGYIFSGDYEPNGKRYLFEHDLGYTADDSEYLQSEYCKQALEKYISGDYKLGGLDEYGRRINIFITLNTPLYGETKIKTGWMVRPNGLITCIQHMQGENNGKIGFCRINK